MAQPVSSSSGGIWDPESRLKQIHDTATVGQIVSFDVASEFARFKAVKSLRSKYSRLIAAQGGGTVAPPLAFDRWLARSALGRATVNRDDGDFENEIGASISSREAIIPTSNVVQPGLVADLSRTYSRDTAIAIADALQESSRLASKKHDVTFDNELTPVSLKTKETKNLLKAVKRATKLARKSASDSNAWLDLERATEALRDHASLKVACLKPPEPPLKVQKVISRSGHIVLLSASKSDGQAMKPYMTINKSHFEKLFELHRRFGTCRDDESDINSLVFCLLCRYEALKGAGSQCAVPGAVFQCLEPYLGKTIECFASPLNCRFERFYSAYPVIERAFGSLGSFYSDDVLNIEEGSFEANPPFVPEIMTFMEKRIHQLLSDIRKGPLSFLVIVPSWGGSGSTAEACSNSKFKQAETVITASDHVFADGAQHRVSDRWRPSSWDTAVILLQNEKGRKKWALTVDQLTASITKAFSRAGNGESKGGDMQKEDLYAWEDRGSRKGGRDKSSQKQYNGQHRKKRRHDER